MTWHYEPPLDFYDLDADPLEEAKTHRVLGGDGRVERFGDHVFLRMERPA